MNERTKCCSSPPFQIKHQCFRLWARPEAPFDPQSCWADSERPRDMLFSSFIRLRMSCSARRGASSGGSELEGFSEETRKRQVISRNAVMKRFTRISHSPVPHSVLVHRDIHVTITKTLIAVAKTPNSTPYFVKSGRLSAFFAIITFTNVSQF